MPDLPPLVLVKGPEELLVDRAVDQVVASARALDPEVEVVRVQGDAYTPGEVAMALSPSLFGGGSVVVVRHFELASEQLAQEVMAGVTDPGEGNVLVVSHRSGTKHKRVLDAMAKAHAHTLEAPALKRDGDKATFVQKEFRAARRRIDADAVQVLVAAAGSDARTLAAACSQLIEDTEGTVTTEEVNLYHGGKVETTGFKVAEAAFAGNRAEALRLVRHAMLGGLDPVPIVAVMAGQARQIGLVASAGNRSSGQVAKELGMAPFMVDKARRMMRGWDGHRLGLVVQALARCDHEVKGAARDPHSAVERLVDEVCRLHG
ncbi:MULTISPECIES: DNA polymerase III subunit delta [Kytococcus]|uniref:DNA-directed DNA polymerase n=1 Tax=Kytococcus schroeteri TaxID=138300 RepID=A0A2I1PA29_9MICO|nr:MULTISPECIES: DNA polymerase III subunit delta [Kytococcus]OFS16113.1 DNA polymerase III subunit delta [Kytococcus sp. HMSC28H12]PKZ41489.1 DNA polymerase III subunit delta [Kytococcus schroeteri]